MRFELTTPCRDCPFRQGTEHGYSDERLLQFTQGFFPCHKTARLDEDEHGSAFTATRDSQHCAGALIYLEKRQAPSQAMRIGERLGLYNHTKLAMETPIR